MDTAFVIGNGESRAIFPIKELKGKGVVWGCNAVYRDFDDLCDHIVAVNPPMYEELKQWHSDSKKNINIYGPSDIVDWDYIIDGDEENYVPNGLKLYRFWRGGDIKKSTKIRTIDFTINRGSGCSAVLLAAESGIKNVVILAFDILGARQWEYEDGIQSREQNNVYKNTVNYPSRVSMKAYLKYEWLFQLRQTIRKYPNTNFHFINRREYIEFNPFLKHYFDLPNIKVGIYADLNRWINNDRDKINWWRL
ncbi:MAG TPA: hypothetical protein DCG42_01770 [Maribacter sp.]|nr:hypothetical protein [Maribacter sp.]